MTVSDARTLSRFDRSQWDVAVIGAGPAGTLTAYLAARRGLRTLLLERKPPGRNKTCGACFNGRAHDILRRVGLESLLAGSAAVPTNQMHIRAWRRSADLRVPRLTVMSRAQFDHEMLKQAEAAGATIVTNVHARCQDASPAAQQKASFPTNLQGIAVSPVTAVGSRTPIVLAARVVVAADGLGHSSIRHLPDFDESVQESSRVGIGGLVTSTNRAYQPGHLWMGVADAGYVGIVRLGQRQLNVAAALEPPAVSQATSPAAAVRSLLEAARMPAIAELETASWIGTPPLTRRTFPVSAGRIFAVGDAAGYIEPFTGEGIANALAGAAALVPCLERALRGDVAAAVAQWNNIFQRRIWSEQRWCRRVARLTRHPRLARLSTRLVNALPFLAWPLIRRLARTAPQPIAED